MLNFHLYDLFWNSLCFSYTAWRFINRNLPQTKLYHITVSKIEHIPYGRDLMVVGLISTFPLSVYSHLKF